MASFLAVFCHWIADILVHKPDMPFYPNANTKYGLALWENVPVQTWLGELMLMLIAAGLMVVNYGLKKSHFPVILLASLHFINYLGMPTNITYALGKNFQNNPLLLRFSVSIALIVADLVPALLVSKHFDRDNEHKRHWFIVIQYITSLLTDFKSEFFQIVRFSFFSIVNWTNKYSCSSTSTELSTTLTRLAMPRRV